jgi:hypothetical protein
MMKFTFVTRAIGASKLALKAKAPTLMVVGGVASMGAGAIVACRKTLQIEEVMEPHVVALERIQEGSTLSLQSYPPQAAQSDRYKVYARVALDGGKLYAIPGVLFVGGAALVFSGHRLLIQRNAALALAFTALQDLITKYRGRVVDQLGHDADQAFLSGSMLEKITDPVTGESVMVQTRDWNEANNDPYNRVFEQGASASWQNDLGVNKMFIANQQRFAQQLLNQQGYLYLSDVYKSLGFEESSISRIVGWRVRRLPDGSRDIPMVDFGLDKPLPDDWKYSAEKAIYLDFNCQGMIVGGKVQKMLEKL